MNKVHEHSGDARWNGKKFEIVFKRTMVIEGTLLGYSRSLFLDGIGTGIDADLEKEHASLISDDSQKYCGAFVDGSMFNIVCDETDVFLGE